MATASTKPPSGMRDFLPADIARRRYVVGIVQRVYEQYGFVPLETPAVENLSTLLGKYGDEGDQLLFRLLHRRNALKRALDAKQVTEATLANQGLRYDLTVPFARVVAQYRDLPRYFRRYQIQPVWRADRPGRGRFREFYQCDVDAVGTTALIADAEVCGAACHVLTELGFNDFVVRLNHRDVLHGLIEAAGLDANASSALTAIDKLDKVGADGVLNELTERYGMDAKRSGELVGLVTKHRGDTSGDILDSLAVDLAGISQAARGIDQLRELADLLEHTRATGRVQIAPELARGLGYYTGPIFELNVADLTGSIGGGGRYDQLITTGKETVPAVGCSLGLERLLLVMHERSMYPDLKTGPQLQLCTAADVSGCAALRVANQLRSQGLRVAMYPETHKLGKQLKYAHANDVSVAAILGTSELDDNQITLKHMMSGTQRTVPVDQARATFEDLCKD